MGMAANMKAAKTGLDYRILVRDGYDACAADFNQHRLGAPSEALTPLLARLRPGAHVLDLGCGTGVPIARALSTAHDVVGVDISSAQIALARQQAPKAAFVLGDITTIEFTPASFDAVVSFYAIFHTPRETHPALFTRIHTWLRPGGLMLASLATTDDGSYTEDFFGVEMYWSNYDMAQYRKMLAACGFDLLAEGELTNGYATDQPPESHPIVFAQKRQR